ncbi:PIN domain nuclease [candidate division KSB1 bacterium]|nr:MAG: PIN domain nuclease [candidate division KSB1 bacterium]
MKVLVDTCIWSLALRRDKNNNDPLVLKLIELINDVRVQMIGPIRQEILSDVKSKEQFETLKAYLSPFPDLPLQKEDYELAAEYFNINRQKGIQGSNTDFLICAVSSRYQLPIFTIDKDFTLFRKNIPVILL